MRTTFIRCGGSSTGTSVGTCFGRIGIGTRTIDGSGPAGRVHIVDWDPAWAIEFERERARLADAIEGVPVEIEHVGSTSVPGLAAKPIIDICVGVEALEVVEERVSAIESLGYTYVPEYEESMPNRRYFRRPADHPRTHHVHCFVLGSAQWTRHLDFRDRLRASEELMDAYGALKLRLARDFGSDRKGYTEAKSTFIERVLSPASDLRSPRPPSR